MNDTIQECMSSLSFWQTLSIIGSVVASAYYIHSEMVADRKLHSEEIKLQTSRWDKLNDRTDKLYEMFYELLKEKK